jgi:hypothetical protein
MKQNQAYEKDIASIRQMMERSVKFLSLSGFSGILAGVYALIGASVVYVLFQYPQAPWQYRYESVKDSIPLLIIIALAVLIASLVTGYLLAARKAGRLGVKFWDSTTQRLVVNLTIPLATGGIFITALLLSGHYGVAAPASLIFYGLALINASPNLYDEIRYLGYCEIGLGIISSFLPGFGLLFWAIGFGVLHLVYGTLMYKKYDA